MPVLNITSKALVCAAALLTAGAAFAGETSRTAIKMAPLHGVSFELGSKYTIAYFQNEGGACKLTLIVTKAFDGEPDTAPARFEATVYPGTPGRLDTAEGRSLELACLASAEAMQVTTFDQVAVDWSAAD